MAATPKWKVYRGGEYIGCTKHAEDAAALVGMSGGTIKYGHGRIIWREGQEEIDASESYDGAARIMEARVQKIHEDAYIKTYGSLPDGYVSQRDEATP